MNIIYRTSERQSKWVGTHAVTMHQNLEVSFDKCSLAERVCFCHHNLSPERDSKLGNITKDLLEYWVKGSPFQMMSILFNCETDATPMSNVRGYISKWATDESLIDEYASNCAHKIWKVGGLSQHYGFYNNRCVIILFFDNIVGVIIFRYYNITWY